MVSVRARQEQVALACSMGMSQRRACALWNVSRSGVRYERTKAASDEPATGKMREIASKSPRYGYRRVQIFMGREGFPMGTTRAYRLWSLAQLQVPRKRQRRRVAVSRPRPFASSNANQVWSYDFVFDAAGMPGNRCGRFNTVKEGD